MIKFKVERKIDDMTISIEQTLEDEELYKIENGMIRNEQWWLVHLTNQIKPEFFGKKGNIIYSKGKNEKIEEW